MGLLATVLAAVLVVGGYTVQNVTVVYWLAAPISPYGVLLFANIWFPLFFGALLVGYAVLKRDWTALQVADLPEERSLLKRGSLAQLTFWTGMFNILNGFGIIYASPPDRTPPLIQAVLQNSGIIFAIPFSIGLLGDKKKYLSPWPLGCIGLVVLSIVVSIIPTIQDGTAGAGFSSARSIGWICVYLLGIVPGAAYNTVQQLYLLRSGALQPGVSADFVTRATLRMLFYCNFWQAFWLLALWWLDVVPSFGTSATPAEFWTNTVFSLTCSYGGRGAAVGPDASQCTSVWGTQPNLWAFCFVLGYSVSYIGSAQLNRESATFNLMVAVVTVAATSAYFLIPGTNPNSSTTPVWSVLVSLALSLSGMVMWKVWESRTPAEQQFSVNVAASEKGYGALLSEEYAAGGDGDYDGFGSSTDGAGYAQGYGYAAAASYADDDRSYYMASDAGVRLGWN